MLGVSNVVGYKRKAWCNLSFPVPNKPSRFCGRKATCLLTYFSLSCLLQTYYHLYNNKNKQTNRTFGDRWGNQLWQRLQEGCHKPVLGVSICMCWRRGDGGGGGMEGEGGSRGRGAERTANDHNNWRTAVKAPPRGAKRNVSNKSACFAFSA